MWALLSHEVTTRPRRAGRRLPLLAEARRFSYCLSRAWPGFLLRTSPHWALNKPSVYAGLWGHLPTPWRTTKGLLWSPSPPFEMPNVYAAKQHRLKLIYSDLRLKASEVTGWMAAPAPPPAPPQPPGGSVHVAVKPAGSRLYGNRVLGSEFHEPPGRLPGGGSLRVGLFVLRRVKMRVKAGVGSSQGS